MKKLIHFFCFLILINITSFSSEICISKDIKIIEINGQYIDLNITHYGGENIVLNQISDKKNSIIKNNLIKEVLQYNLNNNKKNDFLKTRVNFDLFIPQNTNLKYIIKTRNSSVSVNGVNGDFLIDNSKGDVTIENLVGNLKIVNTKKDIKLSNIIGDIYVEGLLSQVITKNTLGVLNIKTTDKKIEIKNADKIGNISTSNASILAEFKKIILDSKIVTSNHDLIIKIPENRTFDFSIFGDLINVNNDCSKLESENFLILGTSNGTIQIKKNYNQEL